jgi:DNA-binding transcriptional regulator YiaG
MDRFLAELIEADLRRAIARQPAPAFDEPKAILARLRHSARLSQADFARALGISVHTLRNWEAGRRRPTGPAHALLRLIAREPQLHPHAALAPTLPAAPHKARRSQSAVPRDREPRRLLRRERYRTDPKYREAERASSRRHYWKHRAEKIAAVMIAQKTIAGRARSLFQRAMLRGEITRPETCSRCGARGRIHGHHTDYSKPLDVVWLCSLCHGEAHRSEAGGQSD